MKRFHSSAPLPLMNISRSTTPSPVDRLLQPGFFSLWVRFKLPDCHLTIDTMILIIFFLPSSAVGVIALKSTCTAERACDSVCHSLGVF